MVKAVEKGDILHISHTGNICQPKDISNIPKSSAFPPMKDTFKIQTEEIDLSFQKFDSPRLSLPGELFLGSIPHLANSFDGENLGSINEVNPENPNRSIPFESSTLLSWMGI